MPKRPPDWRQPTLFPTRDTDSPDAANAVTSTLDGGDHAVADGHIDEAAQINELVDVEKMDALEAYIKVGYRALTPTYIFAIADGMSSETMCDCIDEWFHRPKNFTERFPVLPRMILSGRSVGALHDGLMCIQPPADTLKKIKADYGEHARVLMAIWSKVEHRLSWFASHLIPSVCSRIGLRHGTTGARLSIDRYLPLQECFTDENITEQVSYSVAWDGRFPGFHNNAAPKQIE